jgi:hypothetical protein
MAASDRMKTGIAFPILAAFVAACSVVTGFQVHALRETETARTEIAVRRAALVTSLRRHQQRLRRARTQFEQFRTELEKLPKPRRSVAEIAAAEFANPADNHPDLQLLDLEAQRAEMHASHVRLFRELGLSPEQVEKFVDLAMQRDERLRDLAEAARAEGYAYDDPALLELFRQAGELFEAARLALLGPEADAKYRAFADKSGVAGIVSSLAGGATLAGHPLSPAQIDRLTDLLASFASRSRDGDDADPSTIDWSAAQERAKAFLSPPQLRHLQTADFNGHLHSGGMFGARFNRLFDEARRADAASLAQK